MQTFLPYSGFRASLECLDNRRLGKQRVEARQILKALESGGGWARHPAVRMWEGYTRLLGVYFNTSVAVWEKRGFQNNMPLVPLIGWQGISYEDLPWWLYIPAFHASHRSNLLRKEPTYYGQFGWTEPDNLPYVWPVPENREQLENGG